MVVKCDPGCIWPNMSGHTMVWLCGISPIYLRYWFYRIIDLLVNWSVWYCNCYFSFMKKIIVSITRKIKRMIMALISFFLFFYGFMCNSIFIPPFTPHICSFFIRRKQQIVEPSLRICSYFFCRIYEWCCNESIKDQVLSAYLYLVDKVEGLFLSFFFFLLFFVFLFFVFRLAVGKWSLY